MDGIRRKLTLTGLLAASAVSGACRAPHYAMSDSSKIVHERQLRHNFNGDLGSFVANQFQPLLKEGATEAKVREVKSTYAEPAGLRDQARAQKAQIDDASYDVLLEVLKQNALFSRMNDAMGIQRYVIEVADRNMEYQGLRVAPMTEREVRDVVYMLSVDLLGSLRATQKEGLRSKLYEIANQPASSTLAAKMREAVTYNLENLDVYRKLVLGAASLANLEGNIPEVNSLLRLAAELRKERTGHDSFDAGRKQLEVLKGMKIGDIADPVSPLGRRYSADTSVKTVFEKELENVAKEVRSWGWDSRDNIVQEPLYFMLNVGAQAYAKDKLTSQGLFDVQTAVWDDVATKIGESMPKDPGVNWGEVGLSVLPISSFYKFFTSISPACTSNYFTPEDKNKLDALTSGMEEGHSRIFGYQNAINYQGSNSPARTIALTSGVSCLAQVGTGVYLIVDSASKGSSGGAPAPASTPTLGGSGIGGSGTQN